MLIIPLIPAKGRTLYLKAEHFRTDDPEQTLLKLNPWDSHAREMLKHRE
jgi:hypothetical protein